MVSIQQNLDAAYILNIKYLPIPISEISKIQGSRLDASVYCTEGRTSRIKVMNLPLNIEKLNLSGSFVSDCYYPGRFKRTYVNENTPNSFGFLGSAEMLDVHPHPVKFLFPDKNDLEILKVKYGDLLISRSGTIGNVTFTNHTLTKLLISEHAIRVRCKQYPGYVYAFLRSKIGKSLITSNTYGAVVNQIEPEHLFQIPIPDPNDGFKDKVHNLIIKSFKLRDESNSLVDEAQQILIQKLGLPLLHELPQKVFEKKVDVTTYTVSASKLNNRFDASFHTPICNAIVEHISKHAKGCSTLGDKNISKDIILPGRFKRIYVGENNGTPFFGGKQIYELEPSNMKYLSNKHHSERIKKQLELKENMILVTCSGTIGKVTIVPKHWEGWAANQHIMRIIPASQDIAGYIFSWLNSGYGQELIKKYTYGAVVDEIDDKQLAEVPIPLIDINIQQDINKLVLDSNKKKYEAYLLEKEAISEISDFIYKYNN